MCMGIVGEVGLVGFSLCVFYVVVVIDCNMFIFGGWYGCKWFDVYIVVLLFRFVKCFYFFVVLKCIWVFVWFIWSVIFCFLSL